MVNSTKVDGTSYRTNFFPAPQKLHGWISHGELFCERKEGAALFLRKDRGFWRLYFCAASPVALQRSIAALALLRMDPAVVDLVGQEPAVDGVAKLFSATGFRRYRQLIRMARTGRVAPSDMTAGEAEVVLAGGEDSKPVLDLLLASFDCRAEQLPTVYEIDAALERQVRF